jgi:hypothetical protein
MESANASVHVAFATTAMAVTSAAADRSVSAGSAVAAVAGDD